MCSKRCSRRSRILTLELSKLEAIAKKPTPQMSAGEKWAVFFKYLRDEGMRGKINEILEREEGIAMASEVLLNISRDEEERARLMSEYKYQLDMQSKLVHAKRQGKQEEAQYILNLIAQGLSTEEIRLRLEGDIPGK